jgi:hypothetical protein
MVVVNVVNEDTPMTSMTIINICLAVYFSLIIVRERMRASNKLLGVSKQKMESVTGRLFSKDNNVESTMSETVQIDPEDGGGGDYKEEEGEKRTSQEERDDDQGFNMEKRSDADHDR